MARVKTNPERNHKPKTYDLPAMSDFPLIRKGSKGGYVTVAQVYLMNHGYDIGENGVDGIFGEKMEAAVRQFKKDADIPSKSGIIGPKVWEKMQTGAIHAKREMPPEATQEPPKPASEVYNLTIRGLTKFQAQLLALILKGGADCVIKKESVVLS
jgi:peptidoglycan hydrolase-like protein with peptidoglycan-binding domain